MGSKEYGLYWKAHEAEHNATYYKKELQRLRGRAYRAGHRQEMEGYADYVRKKYNLLPIKRAQDFKNMIGYTHLDPKEQKRVMANFYERQYKVYSGDYDRERKEKYLSRVREHLYYNEYLDDTRAFLWDEFVNADSYNYISDTLPKGDLIFMDTDRQATNVGSDIDLQPDIDKAILKAAQLKGFTKERIDIYRNVLKEEMGDRVDSFDDLDVLEYLVAEERTLNL